MTKFKTNLWRFLSQKTVTDFNLVARLNLAISVALEVDKMHVRTSHRDLKPSNIMLDATGNWSIIDVGIGRTLGDFNIADLSSGSCGTVAFLAPEQLTCFLHFKVDIWALGKIIALIIFEWSSGWKLLWSPKFLKPDEINALGPLVELIDLIKKMIRVSCHYTYC